MEKKLINYVHFYIGCQVSLLNNVTGEWSKWRKLSFNDCNLIVNHGIEAKLNLRPLSDMNEEEKRQYLIFQNYNGYEFFDTFPMDNAYEMKWMLSQGFDLFGLIEAGLAIDKTTLK